MNTRIPLVTGITSRKATSAPPAALQAEDVTCGSTTTSLPAEVPR